MKVVLSAITFAVVICVGYLVVTRLPWIGVYKGCYETAYSTLNEEHIISKRAWTTDEAICIEHKTTLLKSLQCFKNAEDAQPLQTFEKDIILSIAQNIAKGTNSMDQMIADHNKRCSYRKSTLDFDPRSNTWF